MDTESVVQLLGNDSNELLTHRCEKIPRESITVPSSLAVAKVFADSDRSVETLTNLQRLLHAGRLAGTGYLSIFPVDQAIEHTAAFSFYHNPLFFDPENIVKLALEGGCSGVASTLGVLGLVAKKYAQQIPFILKLNHNELLTFPTKHNQVRIASIRQAQQLGAVAVGATVYFGSPESNDQWVAAAQVFEAAHQAGLATILWCYPRNDHFVADGKNYETAVDISAQANHLGVTIEADIIKQKIPTPLHGFQDLEFGKYDQAMYDTLLTDHPIDLVRYQVLHCYSGKIPLISSGGESNGSFDDDLKSAVREAVINKRGGGAGLIMGRKVFNHSLEEGVKLLQNVQDIYLNTEVTVA